MPSPSLYNIYRKGYHPQNNPESAGGPETVLVMQVHAMSKDEALEKAFEQGVTSYPGQRVWAEEGGGKVPRDHHGL